MKTVKQAALRIFFAVEILVFAWVYVFGPQGMHVLRDIKKENVAFEKSITVLRTEIQKLEEEVVAWKTYPFYKEKIAREQLQMARKSDQVYYLT